MFSKVRVPTVAEVVACKIKQEILKGSFKKNSKLPAERMLAEEFGVGRSTVREALQILKTMGLVTVKGGNRGGVFVKEININSLKKIFELMLEFEVTSWKEIMEVRMAIEPSISKIAAINRTKEDLEEIQKVIDENETVYHDHEKCTFLNTLFHFKITESSHNKILQSLFTVISDFISKSGYELYADLENRRISLSEHFQIYLAIKEQDAELAFKLTEQHLLNATAIAQTSRF